MSRPRPFTSKRARASGFTVIEVLISIAILTVGLLGVAALIGATIATGGQAKDMNIANVLASEKLDDLNRWPSNATQVAAGGSLAGPATCAAGDNYCDQVTVSEASGADYETQTAGGVTTTIVHASSGCVDTPANCAVPDPAGGGGSTFTRRWLITLNPSITSPGGAAMTATGTRRITVLVTLVNASSKVPVTFQMSMVRP